MLDGFVVTAAVLKLGYAALACGLVVLGLRYFDRSVGVRFGETLEVIRASAVATAVYYGARILAVALLVGLMLGCTAQGNGAMAGMFPDRYDREISRAVERYWPAYPFPLAWKAQLYQESRLDPAAVSPVGAAGLAQFMPGTWAQVARQLRLPPAASPHHDVAIEAGAWYMARLRRQWSSPRPEEDRHQLAQASYNAGLGHLLEAQRLCGMAVRYSAIAVCLPAVTGRHAQETLTYVVRIAHWRMLMAAGL